MRGNFHVRFLGGWGAAMLPGYPARLDSHVTKGLAAYLIATRDGVAGPSGAGASRASPSRVASAIMDERSGLPGVHGR